ncbi:MAG: ribosome biogenesis GTPase Der [Mycoplasma sp.]|nr:ribosome biogenesis GTPase Der [Mycoplasma sp.]
MSKVVIVGKPNVGKSTLFNRLIRQKKSIVENQPGVTRDRIYGNVDWLGKKFSLIDTGGLTIKHSPFQKNIEIQVGYAIDEADLILFMVSNKESINADDYFISKLLKKQKNKKVLLVVNKSENNDKTNEKSYYSFGYGKPFYISAEHSIGVGDLLDEIIKIIKLVKQKNQNDNLTFCIIGKPNVGKSTLTNSILNEDRVLVSPIPNTTRDSINIDFKYNNKLYTIIDTAGIRRKGKIIEKVEKYAVLRTQTAVAESKIILLMLDGSQEFSEQDEIIGGIAFKANIPTIIVVNKWDLVKKDQHTQIEFIKKIHSKFKFLSWAPIVFISAKKNKKIQNIFKLINDIQKQLDIKVNTSMLNEVVLKAASHNPPSLFKGGRLTIHYATQVKGQIPTFVIFTNDPKYLHFSYARFIENLIRESFEINLVPITIYYKDKNSRIRGIKDE